MMRANNSQAISQRSFVDTAVFSVLPSVVERNFVLCAKLSSSVSEIVEIDSTKFHKIEVMSFKQYEDCLDCFTFCYGYKCH